METPADRKHLAEMTVVGIQILTWSLGIRMRSLASVKIEWLRNTTDSYVNGAHLGVYEMEESQKNQQAQCCAHDCSHPTA